MSGRCALVLGSPGGYARVVRARARRTLLLALAVAASGLVLPLAGFALGVRGSALVALIGIGAVLCAVSWGVASAARVRAAQASAGIRAEELTASRLERLAVTAVVHDVLLGRGDVDHVVLGPICAAVETKYGQGPVRVEGNTVFVGRRALRGDPLGQARASAQLVARFLSVPCMPVLVVSGASGPPQLHAGVWVVSPDFLPQVVESLPRAVDPVAAHSGAMRLQEASEAAARARAARNGS